jgi:sigma-E factor negative regulatory protein RseA
MSLNASSPAQPNPEVWSALADGEASESEVDAALAGWRRSPQAESCWHAYHLIGDSLRSSELASPAARDARVLAAVRSRLAAEPIVLAPSPVASVAAAAAGSTARRTVQRRWRGLTGSAAMVAGVGAVGAMVWLTQVPSAGDVQLADQRPALPAQTERDPSVLPVSVPSRIQVTTAPSGSGAPSPAGAMLRDARLDEYFAAHRQLGAGRPLGTPAGFALPDAAAPAR